MILQMMRMRRRMRTRLPTVMAVIAPPLEMASGNVVESRVAFIVVLLGIVCVEYTAYGGGVR
jgi:hypothetical protein